MKKRPFDDHLFNFKIIIILGGKTVIKKFDWMEIKYLYPNLDTWIIYDYLYMLISWIVNINMTIVIYWRQEDDDWLINYVYICVVISLIKSSSSDIPFQHYIA